MTTFLKDEGSQTEERERLDYLLYINPNIMLMAEDNDDSNDPPAHIHPNITTARILDFKLDEN